MNLKDFIVFFAQTPLHGHCHSRGSGSREKVLRGHKCEDFMNATDQQKVLKPIKAIFWVGSSSTFGKWEEKIELWFGAFRDENRKPRSRTERIGA